MQRRYSCAHNSAALNAKKAGVILLRELLIARTYLSARVMKMPQHRKNTGLKSAMKIETDRVIVIHKLQTHSVY